jgi:hypothetical protein
MARTALSSTQVGDFEVATGGGVWVAAGGGCQQLSWVKPEIFSVTS